jgi:hypothetical protein
MDSSKVWIQEDETSNHVLILLHHVDGYTCIGIDYSDVLGGVGEKREDYHFCDHFPPRYLTEEEIGLKRNAEGLCTCLTLDDCQPSAKPSLRDT